MNNINNTYKSFKYEYQCKSMDVNKEGIYLKTLDKLPQTVEDGPLQYKNKTVQFQSIKQNKIEIQCRYYFCI